MMNTGEGAAGRVPSKNGLLTTIGYQLGRGAPVTYALEGSVAYCGSLIQWLRDNLQIIKDAAESESIARSVHDNGGVYFVPAFAGLFAPYWRTEARGLIVGLTAFNTSAHVTRAALEAAAFQVSSQSCLDLTVIKIHTYQYMQHISIHTHIHTHIHNTYSYIYTHDPYIHI